tara:strand:- start:1954 stop:2184 length:231 start_codon:yes stop_codon:yes gene_type:complete
MDYYKERIDKYRLMYSIGYIGTLERELTLFKQEDRNEFLRFVKCLHETTKADHIQMVNSVPEVIRVLINAYKFQVI